MVDNFLKMWGKGGVPFDVFLRDAPIMAHSIDHEGVLINVSNFWATRLGYDPTEMIGRSSIDFLSDRSRAKALKEHLPKFWDTGRMSNVRYEFLSKENVPVNVVMSAQAINDGNRVRSLAVMFDNGVAARLSEIADTISSSLVELDKLATDLEAQEADRVAEIMRKLKRIERDDP